MTACAVVFVVEQPAAAAGCRLHARCGQLPGRHRGHPVDKLVRLIDDHHIVFRQDVEVFHGIDCQQRMVRDDDVGPSGLVARLLCETTSAKRAARAEALPRGNRHLPPGAVINAGHEFVAVPRGGRFRPLMQALHLPAHG